MLLGARDVELLLVRGERHRFDLPLSLRQLLRRWTIRGGVDRVEVHPAVALGEEPEALLIRHPAERRIVRARPAELAHPRIVVQRVEHARLARLRIDDDQPAILVVLRAHVRDRDRAVVGDLRHHPPRVLSGPFRRDRLARLEVQHGERAFVLRVADEGARGNVLGVARFGDVVRDVRPLRAVGALSEDDEDVRVVGRELQVGRRLPLGEVELWQGARLFFRFVLFLLLGLDARVLDQLLLLLLDELLALGRLRIALLRLDVGELRDRAAVERHEKEVVLPREGDGRLVPRPARVRFAAGRARDLPPRARHGIDEHDVAFVDEQHAAVRLVPDAVGRRRTAALVVTELAQLTAVAVDDPRRRLVLAGAAPLEVELRGIARPAQAGRRIADEFRPAHDAVDGERKGVVPLFRRRAGRVRRSGGDNEQDEERAQAWGKSHEKVYNS